MKKEDVKLILNKTLWEKAMEKMKAEFKLSKIKNTDFMLIIILLGLYAKTHHPKNRSLKDECYLALGQLSDVLETNIIQKTISVPKVLLEKIKEYWSEQKYSQTINGLMALYINTNVEEYTDRISPLYTIVGSKNKKMQETVANVVKMMNLPHKDTVLIDSCCATGSLFFGLDTYCWQCVVLNDLNKLRTNFLNVLKNDVLKLIKVALDTDLSAICNEKNSEARSEMRKTFKKDQTTFENNVNKKTLAHDFDVKIAWEMFIFQCIDKKNPDNAHDIFNKILKFLPASLKLNYTKVIITQQNCLNYLRPSINAANMHIGSNRLLLFDPPYIRSEKQCAAKGIDYTDFHRKTARYLQRAQFPFLYHCRSTAPKSDGNYTKEDSQHLLLMELAEYFFNKGYYFQKVNLPIAKATELIISNRVYDHENQFQWTDDSQDLL